MAQWGKPEVERLKPTVTPAGFRYVKKGESFVRAIAGGRQKLGGDLWNYNPLFAFSLTMTVRLDAVQAILNEFTGSPPRFHGITTTSFRQLEFLGLRREQPAVPCDGGCSGGPTRARAAVGATGRRLPGATRLHSLSHRAAGEHCYRWLVKSQWFGWVWLFASVPSFLGCPICQPSRVQAVTQA